MSESLIVVRGPIGVGKTSVSEAIRSTMPDRASLVDPDAIKSMVDPHVSSDWRRDIAHETAGFITKQILEVPRTPIVAVHTKHQAELARYRLIAEEYQVPLFNVLLVAPLEVCQDRVASRSSEESAYRTDDEMVSVYYCNLEPLPGDLVFDTSTTDPEEIAERIGLA